MTIFGWIEMQWSIAIDFYNDNGEGCIPQKTASAHELFKVQDFWRKHVNIEPMGK